MCDRSVIASYSHASHGCNWHTDQTTAHETSIIRKSHLQCREGFNDGVQFHWFEAFRIEDSLPLVSFDMLTL